MSGWKILLPLFFLILCPVLVQADGISDKWDALPKEKKAIYLNAGIASVITLWGAFNWDYFQSSPTFTSEGWFGRNTEAGGADKLGHAYSAYFLTHLYTYSYQKWGFESDSAPFYGALSAFGIQTSLEFGDSFSRYGFSYEDFIANGVGSVFGYLTWRYPKIGEKIDFRAEIVPSFETADIITDYDHYKYLLVLKLNGFKRFNSGPLSYLELHLGYFAKNFLDQNPDNNKRNLYVGIGINLSHIFRQNGYKKISTFFNYYQAPYTYLPYEHDFND